MKLNKSIFIILLVLFLEYSSGSRLFAQQDSWNEVSGYELIHMTQYLHKLCILVAKDREDEWNRLYDEAQMPKFEKVAPLEYNNYIQNILMWDSTDKFLEHFNDEQLSAMKVGCDTVYKSNIEKVRVSYKVIMDTIVNYNAKFEEEK